MQILDGPTDPLASCWTTGANGGDGLDDDAKDDDAKKAFCRMAEVFAGLVSYTNHELRRLFDFLGELGELDNTIFIVTSDNGASREGSPVGSVNENLFFNGTPDSIEDNLTMIDEIGSTSR